MTDIPFENLPYGFLYGAGRFERACSDNAKGWVIVSVRTPKDEIQVYVTKTGKVRVYRGRVELIPASTLKELPAEKE